ncbi:MAG: hypothetical protein WKG00_40970 [Polyangiaceae bacterium]
MHTIDYARVRAEPLVEQVVPTFGHEVQIELAERRRERVRVAEMEGIGLVGDLQPVQAEAAPPREAGLEQPGVPGGRHGLRWDGGIVGHHPHPQGVRTEGAHHQGVALEVRPQRGVRVGAVGRRHALEIRLRHATFHGRGLTRLRGVVGRSLAAGAARRCR